MIKQVYLENVEAVLKHWEHGFIDVIACVEVEVEVDDNYGADADNNRGVPAFSIVSVKVESIHDYDDATTVYSENDFNNLSALENYVAKELRYAI